jgi:hypothetical protein
MSDTTIKIELSPPHDDQPTKVTWRDVVRIMHDELNAFEAALNAGEDDEYEIDTYEIDEVDRCVEDLEGYLENLKNEAADARQRAEERQTVAEQEEEDEDEDEEGT